MTPELTASYAHCRRIVRRSASSFYYSFLLLPRDQRWSMCALYAFLRRTDDLVDDQGTVEERRAAIRNWRATLHRAVAGTYDDPMLPALGHTLRAFDIPSEYLEAVIDGVEMDLTPPHYETFEQLEQYCQRVASAVGLACLRIWGCRAPQAEQLARQCGIAFQMTNILRDLKEDAARGRLYLPREDLTRFGYSPEQLSQGVLNEPLANLLAFEIQRTEQLYAEAAALETWLAPDARRAFGSMYGVYHALLEEIKRQGTAVLLTRVRLSRWRKMRIATQWLLTRRGHRSPAGVTRP